MKIRVIPFLFALVAALPAAGTLVAQDVEINWKISNRFATFEALGEPRQADALFETYRVRPEDGGLEGWHARLDRTLIGGTTSPFASFLEQGRPLHWNPETGEHRDAILKYVKNEDAQRVRARLWVTGDAAALDTKECWWSFRDTPLPCTEEVELEIPLTEVTEVVVIIERDVIEARLEPEHVVIVGMGDSYGSGEGNPDVAAQWKGITSERGHEWLATSLFRLPLPDRTWLDDRCNRSFFSFQNLAALETASDDPHRFVTFLHYACSGAEVFDGLLAPQFVSAKGGGYLPYSQVNMAVRELCARPVRQDSDLPRGQYTDVTSEELDGIDITAFDRRPYPASVNWFPTELQKNDALDRYMRQFRGTTGSDHPSVGFFTCPEGALRAPDFLFLSVGGNDIGFADLVKYALLPGDYDSGLVAFFTLPEVCPPAEYRVDPRIYPTVAEHCLRKDLNGRPHAGDLIYGRGRGDAGSIGKRMELLYNILEYRLDLPAKAIFQTQYPDPLRVLPPKAPACGPLDTEAAVVYGSAPGRDPFSAWEGLKLGAPLNIARNWTFNLTSEEGHATLAIFDRFRVELAKAAQAHGISFVCETRDAFIGHGWWRGYGLNLPNAGWGPNDRRWDADLWAPYAYDPKDRAIRTGNDSAMTQPASSSVIAGAVHPNLTGHRLLADRLAARVEDEMAARKAFNPGRIGDMLRGLGNLGDQ